MRVIYFYPPDILQIPQIPPRKYLFCRMYYYTTIPPDDDDDGEGLLIGIIVGSICGFCLVSYIFIRCIMHCIYQVKNINFPNHQIIIVISVHQRGGGTARLFYAKNCPYITLKWLKRNKKWCLSAPKIVQSCRTRRNQEGEEICCMHKWSWVHLILILIFILILICTDDGES